MPAEVLILYFGYPTLNILSIYLTWDIAGDIQLISLNPVDSSYEHNHDLNTHAPYAWFFHTTRSHPFNT
jgi:hypothetical protein